MDKPKIVDVADATDVAINPVPTLAPSLAPAAPPDIDCDIATNKKSEVQEIGGRIGPDPTRFGDWEKAGRCIDF